MPPGQVDLAFLRAQEVIAKDEDLQRYCPTGVPILRVDKEYYLHVVNSLRGLPYTVVQPLTDGEQQTAAKVRSVVLGVEKVIAQTKPSTERLNQVTKAVAAAQAMDPALVDEFWLRYEEMREELCAGERMDAEV